jgi:hypothetical protein
MIIAKNWPLEKSHFQLLYRTNISSFAGDPKMDTVMAKEGERS